MAIKRVKDVVAGTVRTTDGTDTVVATMTVPTDYAGWVHAVIVGRNASTGASEDQVFEIGCTVKNVAGTVTAGTAVNIAALGAAANTTTLVASGATVVLKIANIAGTATIDWFGEITLWATAP